jgi:hypothetical protein
MPDMIPPPLPKTCEELLTWHKDYPLAQQLIAEYAPKLWKTPIIIKIVHPYRLNDGLVTGQCLLLEPPYINMCLGGYLINKRTTPKFLNTLAHEIAHWNVGPGHDHGPVWSCEYFRLRDVLKRLQIKLPRPRIVW